MPVIRLCSECRFPTCPARFITGSRTRLGDDGMSNDIRDYPARSQDNLSRFLGGSPLAVLFRLILLSILVGVVLSAIGFDPLNIIYSIRLLVQRLYEYGFDAFNWLWRYFLLGAVIVVPLWFLSRVFAPRGR